MTDMIDLGVFMLVTALGICVRSYLNQARPWFRVLVTLGRDTSEPFILSDEIAVVHETTVFVWDTYLNREEICRHLPCQGEQWGYGYEVEGIEIIPL